MNDQPDLSISTKKKLNGETRVSLKARQSREFTNADIDDLIERIQDHVENGRYSLEWLRQSD